MLDEELVLFDEDGPWRFFQERMTQRLANSWEALTYCKPEEIAQHRAVIGVVRDLLLLPDALRERRAELVKELESYD